MPHAGKSNFLKHVGEGFQRPAQRNLTRVYVHDQTDRLAPIGSGLSVHRHW